MIKRHSLQMTCAVCRPLPASAAPRKWNFELPQIGQFRMVLTLNIPGVGVHEHAEIAPLLGADQSGLRSIPCLERIETAMANP